MLVVSRQIDDTLVITMPDGRTITVLVCGYDRGNVRLGIDAPRDVKVLRAELLDRPRPAAKE